jgi:predicted Rossmann fold nucleotide-binding protein DprA/Smf involved in DNA uptake
MNTAVVGSRSFQDYAFLEEILDGYTITKIVSGGARGADQLAERYAKEKEIPTQIFKPDYIRYGKGNPYAGNYAIIDNSDQVVAFWDNKSRGTSHSIKYAQKMGKKVYIIPI